EGAFWGCIKLTSLNIPASVKEIGYYSFVGDTALTEINVASENSIYKSEQGILYNKNRNVLKAYPAGKAALSYVIPSTVDSIEVSAFSTSRFTSITIPNSVKYMAHATFLMCDGITAVNIPSSVTYLRNNPFYYCKNMTAVTVDPANLENQSVDGVLFKKETGQPLQTIIYYPPAKPGSSYVIPNTVTYVRSSTFLNCLNLTSITIPASVETIRSGMLEGCSNLTTINVYRTTPVNL
ncbi:leucine-rich repeat domain-containing protein, partial [bacterium]|nr:leucine-rich repeat domain-containing protein [bacterium]